MEYNIHNPTVDNFTEFYFNHTPSEEEILTTETCTCRPLSSTMIEHYHKFILNHKLNQI